MKKPNPRYTHATQNVRRSTDDVTFRTPNLSMSLRSDTPSPFAHRRERLHEKFVQAFDARASFERTPRWRRTSKRRTCPSPTSDTLGRGFVIVDIRSPDEWAEGSKSTWKKICLAVMDEETGEVEMNPYFLAQIKEEFLNTLSRILLLCDDGTERSEIAWRGISKQGYTQCKIVEGGSEAFFEAFPLTDADKRAGSSKTNRPGLVYAAWASA